MSVNPITMKLVPAYRDLDGEDADNYYRAGQRMALVYNEVINPFEISLKESTGYSDENIPKTEEEIPKNIGDFSFMVRATPTTKRPGYKDVVDELDGFLRTRLGQYLDDERPVRIRTIDGEPYIQADDILLRIRDAKRTVLSEGVRVSITERPDLPEASSVVIPLGMDLSVLSEGNVARYLEALRINESYGEFISAFENDLLGLTGFSDENPPEETEQMYRAFGSHIFNVRTVPYESTSWGKVLGGLDKPVPKKKIENAGDLTLIEEGIHIPRLEVYGTRVREGEPLIQLNALISRMDELREDNTCTKVRQKPINHYPIV